MAIPIGMRASATMEARHNPSARRECDWAGGMSAETGARTFMGWLLREGSTAIKQQALAGGTFGLYGLSQRAGSLGEQSTDTREISRVSEEIE
jgi:hypothetical protein